MNVLYQHWCTRAWSHAPQSHCLWLWLSMPWSYTVLHISGVPTYLYKHLWRHCLIYMGWVLFSFIHPQVIDTRWIQLDSEWISLVSILSIFDCVQYLPSNMCRGWRSYCWSHPLQSNRLVPQTCVPCVSYVLKDQETLTFKLLYAMDDNDSLKHVACQEVEEDTKVISKLDIIWPELARTGQITSHSRKVLL